MRRYHFHIRCGDRALFDEKGRLLSGLSAAALEAERLARTLMKRDQAILTTWEGWRLDVRDRLNVLLFTLPFSEVRLDRSDGEDYPQPAELPDTEAIWSLSVQHA